MPIAATQAPTLQKNAMGTQGKIYGGIKNPTNISKNQYMQILHNFILKPYSFINYHTTTNVKKYFS